MTTKLNIPVIYQAIVDKGFRHVSIEECEYNFDAIKVYIPLKSNGVWSDGYRTRLDALAAAFSAMDLRWAAEYKDRNHLISKDEDGEPWMLFNGGESIDLIHKTNV